MKMAGVIVFAIAGAIGTAHAQTTIGTATTMVFPVVAQTSSFVSEVTLFNPGPSALTAHVTFFEANNSSTPGTKACGDTSVPANRSVQFSLGTQCPLAAGSHFGLLVVADSANPQSNSFYGYTRMQNTFGIGFSVEGFPMGNFTDQVSNATGLKRQAASPTFQTNCFVGSLDQPVSYELRLFDDTTGAQIGETLSGSLNAFEQYRHLDVFGPNGVNASAGDQFNVRAQFTQTSGGTANLISFCTVQDNTSFGADFRIAKSFGVGTGTTIVFPVVAQTPSFVSEVTIFNPGPSALTAHVTFFEANNSSTPGTKACGHTSVPANRSVQFSLGTQCPLAAGSHFGLLVVADSANPQSNSFYGYTRMQNTFGIGFSVEGLPMGNFTDQVSNAIGLKKQAAAPTFQTNCFVGSLEQPVSYQLRLFNDTTGAQIGSTLTGSLAAFQQFRYLDVFGPNGVNASAGDQFNVRAQFTQTSGGTANLIGFCTVQDNTSFGADFRIAKSSGVPAGIITEFSAGITKEPSGITAGPDGNLWFTETFLQYYSLRSGLIGRITPAGVVTEFSVGVGAPHGPITAGPDGNLWFTEYGRIVRITPAGVVTEFSAGISDDLWGITAGPDGNLWFTEYNGDRIGRITPLGVVTEFSAGITAGSRPFDITAGPDGNLWFTEAVGLTGGNRIGRITPLGVVTEFSAGISADAFPSHITAGPDGNLWFTETYAHRIGRITPAGVVTEFSAGISLLPVGITAGPDGNLWFTEQEGSGRSGARIGRITPAGVVTEFSAGITALPVGITAGPDGNLWFTESGYYMLRSGRIGRITPPSVITEFDN